MLVQAVFRGYAQAVASIANAATTKKSGALRGAAGGAVGAGWMTAVFVGVGPCVHWILL